MRKLNVLLLLGVVLVILGGIPSLATATKKEKTVVVMQCREVGPQTHQVWTIDPVAPNVFDITDLVDGCAASIEKLVNDFGCKLIQVPTPGGAGSQDGAMGFLFFCKGK